MFTQSNNSSNKNLKWIRTCQECGHKQSTKQPNSEKQLTDSYKNAMCRKCKSEALDYGSLKDVS